MTACCAQRTRPLVTLVLPPPPAAMRCSLCWASSGAAWPSACSSGAPPRLPPRPPPQRRAAPRCRATCQRAPQQRPHMGGLPAPPPARAQVARRRRVHRGRGQDAVPKVRGRRALALRVRNMHGAGARPATTAPVKATAATQHTTTPRRLGIAANVGLVLAGSFTRAVNGFAKGDAILYMQARPWGWGVDQAQPPPSCARAFAGFTTSLTLSPPHSPCPRRPADPAGRGGGHGGRDVPRKGGGGRQGAGGKGHMPP